MVGGEEGEGEGVRERLVPGRRGQFTGKAESEDTFIFGTKWKLNAIVT